MVLENRSYVPTLAIRASEMYGLEFLPAVSKDRITPCFLLAPWPNAINLDRALDRVEKAYRNDFYFLDIDRDYEFSNLEAPAQQALAHLLDPANSFSNWCSFVEQRKWIWPCIQVRGQTESQIRSQINRFQELGRAYCLRITRDRFPENLSEVVAAFAASGASDFAIILEGGWHNDALSLASWFDGVMRGYLGEIDASVPIVLSCTSMPKLFSEFDGGISNVPFSNRQLLSQISAGSNRARVIYGDWGSTRPREPSGFANRPLARIDYPTNSAWHIARNKGEDWNYTFAARAIISSGIWDGNMNIWGEEQIRNTAISEDLGINTPQKNVAARVNIHLHRQAFFGTENWTSINLDEDWED